VTLGFIAFTYAFQQTAVIPAIPTIERQLHASTAWSAWLLSGYLLVATVATPAFGRLADLYGERRVLLLSLLIFLAGSVGAASSPNLPFLIVCRGAQGAGGPVLPLLFALARRHLPNDRVDRAIAGLTGAFGFGAAVGFGTGGVMTQLVSWRLLFATGAVVVAAGIAAQLVTVPRIRAVSGGRRFDMWGTLWLAAASLGVLLALTIGEETGWTAPAPLLLFATAASAALLWIRTELRRDQPLIDVRVLRDPTVWRINVATASLGWGRFVGLLLIPQLVSGPGGSSYGFAADATIAGLYLLPDGTGTFLGGPTAGWLSRRLSPATTLAVGLCLIASGGALIAALPGQPAAVLIGAFLFGFGGGNATQASSLVTTRDVPSGAASASSSLNSTVRRFAGGVGGQVSVVVLAATATGSASASTGGFELVFSIAAGLSLLGAAFSRRIDHIAAVQQ
jgi:predicted MFS family arabinose efflux permease